MFSKGLCFQGLGLRSVFLRFKSCRHLKRRAILYMQLSKKTLTNGAGSSRCGTDMHNSWKSIERKLY